MQTTELRDIATREPKEVKIGGIKEPNEETESSKNIIPGPAHAGGWGRDGQPYSPDPAPRLVLGPAHTLTTMRLQKKVQSWV